MKKRTYEQQLEFFSKSRLSFAVFNNSKILYRSVGKGISPPVRYIQKNTSFNNNIAIYDRYVGRAAALLFLIIKPQTVLTTIMTVSALNLLRKHKINCFYIKKSQYLMGSASAKMCTWEKLAYKKRPKEFFDLVKKQLIR